MVKPRHSLRVFHVVTAAAVLLRLMLIPNPGFEADISFWKSWGLATVDFGIVEGMKVTNNNYPTPFAYTLGGLVWIYKLFADPHNFNEFWSNTNLWFLTISKMLSIIADFGIAWLLIYIGRHAKRLGFPEITLSFFALSFYELLAIFYLLSPISLIDGAVWGQVDSVGVFIFLGAIVLGLNKQPFLAGLIYMLAMMTKLQNMIYGPLFFLFIWQLGGLPGLIRVAGGALFGFLGLNIEFLLTRNMDRVLGSLTENYDYFPWMSLMAYNVWWIVTGAKGFVTSDKLTVLGLLNAKTVGLLIFSSFYLFCAVRQFLEQYMDKTRSTGQNPLLQRFFEHLIIVNAAFFLFQTQSHDRYAFPLAVFALLWAPFYLSGAGPQLVRTRLKLFALHYVLFTTFYFYNLHTALVVHYPKNGIPLLSLLTQPFFTVSTAIALLMLFGSFLLHLTRSSRSTRYALWGTGIVCVGGLVFLNRSLITRTPVSLTTITPYISEQAYGTRQTNRAVQSSFGGPYKWTRLSVQYLFYDKGIGTHANSKLVFDIDKRFTRFTSDIGIDTEAGAKASAVFMVYGDGTLLYTSEKMGRFDLPKHIDVDITGVKFLRLSTQDAGDGNNDDHTDWLNPVLWP